MLIYQLTVMEVIEMIFISFLVGLILGVVLSVAFKHRDKLSKVFGVFIVAALILPMVGCGQKESHDQTEMMRSIANDNSMFNAQVWRATSPQFSELGILTRGDSTQTRDCPQGDGWASVDLSSKDGRQQVKLKCSTYSKGIGCMTADDFNKRANLASQENKCSNEVPYPIPKIVK